MITVRKGVFETNSSSVHTITIDSSGLEKSKLPLGKDHKVITYFGKFGRDHCVYQEQSQKLSYLISQLYYCCRIDAIEESYAIEDSYAFQIIEEALIEYIPGCEGLRIIGVPEPEIDHQSVWKSESRGPVNLYNKESIINFIFNKYVSLTTDSD